MFTVSQNMHHQNRIVSSEHFTSNIISSRLKGGEWTIHSKLGQLKNGTISNVNGKIGLIKLRKKQNDSYACSAIRFYAILCILFSVRTIHFTARKNDGKHWTWFLSSIWDWFVIIDEIFNSPLIRNLIPFFLSQLYGMV